MDPKATAVSEPGTGFPADAKVRGQELLCRRWSRMREHARVWWGELTEDDLDEVVGQCERLIAVIQRRYGRSRSEAELEVNRFLIRAERLVSLN